MTADRPAAPYVTDGPVPSSAQGERLLELVKVMARLRGPDGCPWDREQTHQTLARHLLEETHELLEAIDAGGSDEIRDELGDLLLQVVFHAQMAAEDGRWDVDDVAEGLVEKLVHRHPHVFGDVEVSGAEEVLTNWERLKADESGGRGGVDAGIPETLPALARAAKVQRRAAGWGVGWSDTGEAATALRTESGALSEGDRDELERGIGAVLFAAVAVARLSGVDPEGALRRFTRDEAERFERQIAEAETTREGPRGLARGRDRVGDLGPGEDREAPEEPFA